MKHNIKRIALITTLISYLSTGYALAKPVYSKQEQFNQAAYSAVKWSDRYNLEPSLVLAVIEHESDFRPYAKNRNSSASGLMQLIKATRKEVGLSERDKFDVDENIRGGCEYLSKQRDRFGNETLALAAYKAGPNAVINAGYRVPNDKGRVDIPTQDWIKSVKRKQMNYERVFSKPSNERTYVRNNVENLEIILKETEREKNHNVKLGFFMLLGVAYACYNFRYAFRA